jgi:hypothetical protein
MNKETLKYIEETLRRCNFNLEYESCLKKVKKLNSDILCKKILVFHRIEFLYLLKETLGRDNLTNIWFVTNKELLKNIALSLNINKNQILSMANMNDYDKVLRTNRKNPKYSISKLEFILKMFKYNYNSPLSPKEITDHYYIERLSDVNLKKQAYKEYGYMHTDKYLYSVILGEFYAEFYFKTNKNIFKKVQEKPPIFNLTEEQYIKISNK